MIKAVDKLREALAGCIMEAGHANRFDTYWITKDAADKLIDEIEAEFEENCMLLPLDADFERIRVSEVMNTPFGALPIGGIGCNRVWFMVDGRAEYAMCDSVSHVKQRTLEDVLAEFGRESIGASMQQTNDLLAKYADEIRELMGGDA